MGNEEDNSEKADHHNVIIIGGGISGLQAASELTKRGMEDFVLFEGSERLGGRIKTITVGWLVSLFGCININILCYGVLQCFKM